MELVYVITYFCALISFSQARGGVSDLANSRARFAEMTDKLRYSSEEAVIGFRQAMSKLDSAMMKHERAKRDIESSYDINNIADKVPDNCKNGLQSKLVELKNKALEEYTSCSGGVVFKAIGDSVRIVTLSLQLFSQIFQSIDDITSGFRGCYDAGVFHSIICTVEALDTLGSDTRSSVDLALTYGDNVKSLANDVTQIIAVCQHKQKPKQSLNITDLCSQNYNDL